MKIAVSGKGGVGKSTVAAALALLMAERGQNVLAIDADPDANLAACLGISEEDQALIVPIARQVDLIEQRTGARVREYGQIFRLNPHVSDIADRHAFRHHGVALVVLGAVDRGGGGCACPESVLIRALVMDLVLERDEALVMDMEAGVEHLGRSTAKGVDALIVVLEPGQRSIETGRRIVRMAQEIGLKNIQFAGNKVTGPDDEAFIRNAFPGHPLLGIIPYAEGIRMSDRTGRSVLDTAGAEARERFASLLAELERRLAVAQTEAG